MFIIDCGSFIHFILHTETVLFLLTCVTFSLSCPIQPGAWKQRILKVSPGIFRKRECSLKQKHFSGIILPRKMLLRLPTYAHFPRSNTEWIGTCLRVNTHRIVLHK